MDFFGEGGLASTTARAELGQGFYALVGLMSGEDAERCRTLLAGGQTPRTRLVASSQQQQQKVEQVTEFTQDMRAYRDAYLLATIREWNLTEKGQILPVDLPTIQRIPERYLNLIFLAAKALNEPPTPEKQGE